MKSILWVVFVTLTLLAASCSTDFDVTADYEEIMVVIGLLDPTAPVQYIRIEKGFLDKETSALTQAQIADSIYYKPGELIVKLQGVNSGQELDITDSIVQIPKDSGDFASGTNPIYAFSINLNRDDEYRLVIENTTTGKLVTATTPLIKDFQLSRPPGDPNTDYEINLAGVDLNNNSRPVEIQWASAPNGKVYEIIIRFHYIEYKNGIGSPGDTTFVDWPVLKNFTSSGTEGLQTMLYPLDGSAFYSYLSQQLTADANIIRKPLDKPIEFLFVVGGQVLWDYIRVNTQGQTGITSLEAQTAYTNLDDGLGILSTRLTKNRPNVSLRNQSLDSLSCGRFTKSLNFQVNTAANCN